MFTKDNYKSNNNNNNIYVGLGNYCLTAMLLKDNNLKFESYPFDWMVSCTDNIIHCVNNNFEEFLNKNNYICIKNKTKNKYYLNNTNKIFKNIDVDHQHHNLLNNSDYDYINRCVDRFNNLEKYKNIIFIMIRPLYLNNIIDDKYDKIIELYNVLNTKIKSNVELIIFDIKNKNNINYKENLINDNILIVELDTHMVKGKYGMMYFDKNGIQKFLNIITNYKNYMCK
jgi:hypothetical protein